MRAYLHIGLPKTGTSTIQAFLAKNAALLAEKADTHVIHGFGKSGNAVDLALQAMAYGKDKESNFQLRRASIRDEASFKMFRDRIQTKFREQLGSVHKSTLLISSEGFSTILKKPSELQDLNALLREFCSDVKVVVYLRRQDEAALSGYSQQVKSGSRAPFRMKVPPSFSDYKTLLDRWAAVFGKDNLEVGLLERAQLKNGDLIDDFCARCGIAPEGLQRVSAKNPSLGAEALWFLREMNKYVPSASQDRRSTNPLRGNLVAYLNDWGEGQEKLRLMTDERRQIMDQVAASNAEVARDYFGRDDGQLFAPDVAEVDERAKRRLTKKRMVEIAAYLWRRQQEYIESLQASEPTQLKKPAGNAAMRKGKPMAGAKPVGAGKSVSGGRPLGVGKPLGGGKPQGVGNPPGGARPAVGGRPQGVGNPPGGARPAGGGRPQGVGNPPGGARPAGEGRLPGGPKQFAGKDPVTQPRAGAPDIGKLAKRPVES